MQYPLVTSIYASILALIFAILTIRVSAARGKYHVKIGDGSQPDLLARIRAHANFAEYVPLILILTALLEGRRTSIFIIHALLLSLVVARILHPIGLAAPPDSSRHSVCRSIGAGLTLIVLAATAVILLFEGLTTPRY